MTLLCSLVGLLAPAPLHGQRLPRVPPPAYAIAPPPTSFRVDTTRAIPRTYWLEGGVIGGVGMGVLGIMFAQGMGEGNTSAAGYTIAFLIGASVGFPVGALIGGQIPKRDR